MRTRKLTPDDRMFLAKVFKENGNAWTYKALGVWFGAVPFAVLEKEKRWTSRRLAAYRFLREIAVDYTFKAIYGAAEEIVKEAAQKQVRRSRRSKAA